MTHSGAAGYPCPCGYVQECALLNGKCRHCHLAAIRDETVQQVHDNIHRDRALAELTARHQDEYQALLSATACGGECAELLRHFDPEGRIDARKVGKPS